MHKVFSTHLISSLIGGIVGAAVVLSATGQISTVLPLDTLHAQDGVESLPAPPSGKFKEIEVEKLVITGEASLLNKEGVPEVVIRDGSVLASKKVIVRQIQSHAIVGNRLFLTPDDLVATPMEQWRFFAEIGTSVDAGGEVIVRSADGSASVHGPTLKGAFLRTGFDTDGKPQIVGVQNGDRNSVPINHELSEQQKRMLMVR